MATKELVLVDQMGDMCAENDVVLQPLRVAEDIMNKEVKTLTLDHTVKTCIKLMKDFRIRHLPLVDISYDGSGKLYFVGIISERDVLRVISESLKEPGEQKIDQRALRRLLAQLVTRNPKTISPDTPIAEIVTIMLDNHFDMLPVIVKEEVAGIITTVDIIKIFSKLDKAVCQLCPEFGKMPRPGDLVSTAPSDMKALLLWMSQTVREVMTEQVICLTPQDDLARAISLMQEHEFRHIPIVDEQGKLKGIVSDRDVLRYLHYVGKRPMGKQKKFREHLFRVNPNFANLKLPLDRVMARKVTHILPGRSICDATNILRKLKVNCLPVLDEQDNLLGIVTMTDLMSVLLTFYGEKVEGR